jgi:hypothetical protein
MRPVRSGATVSGCGWTDRDDHRSGRQVTAAQGHDHATATDLLFVILGPEVYRSLVLERGWTVAAWTARITGTITRELFDMEPLNVRREIGSVTTRMAHWQPWKRRRHAGMKALAQSSALNRRYPTLPRHNECVPRPWRCRPETAAPQSTTDQRQTRSALGRLSASRTSGRPLRWRNRQVLDAPTPIACCRWPSSLVSRLPHRCRPTIHKALSHRRLYIQL